MKHGAEKTRSLLFSLLVLGLLSFASRSASAFSDKLPFDISADIIDYIDANQKLHAEGHVVITQTSSTLTADYVTYDRANNHFAARGNVVLRENGEIVAGDQMVYDLAKQEGSVTGGKGYNAPWLFQADSWEKKLDYYLSRQTSVTSCSLLDPHYHIRASRVHVVPGELFWSWNNRFHVDTVGMPFFYSPFMYKALGLQRVVFQATPGHDTVNGNFAKTKTTIRFTPDIYDRFRFDHYTNAGEGLGNELFYTGSNGTKGSLFGYYINPHGNAEQFGAPKAPQYNIRAYHYQAFQNNYVIQSNVNLRKNVSFNNQYFRDDYNQSQVDLPSSIALSRQGKRFSQHLVAERTDSPDIGDTSPFAETHMQSASYPRYDFTAYEAPIWSPGKKREPRAISVPRSSSTLSAFGPPNEEEAREIALSKAPPSRLGPLMLSGAGSIGETYLRQDRRSRTSGSGQATLSQSLRISDKWTASASLLPQMSWTDKPAPGGSIRGFLGRYTTTEGLRYRPFSSLTLDNGYTLTERFAPNSFRRDDTQDDGGIETHRFGFSAYWRPSRSILLRSSEGIDIRRIRNEDPNTYRQRKFDAWLTELTLQPQKAKYDIFFRYSLAHYPERVGLWEATWHYVGVHKTNIESGILYNRGLPGQLTWNNRIGVYFSPGWRVDAVINSLVPSAGVYGGSADGRLINSEFIVIRDMHCWEAQFTYRNIPLLSNEYSLTFNLKLGSNAEKAITNEELEGQFYPWRDPSSNRRPLYQTN